jgi:signal transduction histidine kinase
MYRERAIAIRAKNAPRRSSSPRRLTSAEVCFYRAFVELQRSAFAVLHLRNPDQPSTWELVACNALARKLFGDSAQDYLHLPTIPLAVGRAKRDQREGLRSAVLSGKPRWLGQIMLSGARRPASVTSVRAYPYPHRCVGIVAESAGLTPADLLRSVLHAQEQDHKRISRDLHDSLGQMMAALKWKLATFRQLSIENAAVTQMLDECLNLAKDCHEEIRAVSYEMRPPVLETLGLDSALEWQAKRVAQQCGLKVTLNLQPSIGRLGPDVELALFRAFQECLSNVRRHAQTDTVVSRLRRKGRNVVLEVEDRGVGLPQRFCEELACGKRGTGLLKMRERMSELGGTLEIRSSSRGTTVCASVPRRLRT